MRDFIDLKNNGLTFSQNRYNRTNLSKTLYNLKKILIDGCAHLSTGVYKVDYSPPPPGWGNYIKLVGKKGREKGREGKREREGLIFCPRGRGRLDFLP